MGERLESAVENGSAVEKCEGCGLEIEGGSLGCQAAFDQFRARETTELATSYVSTRLTVDIYCLQHPDRYCASAKSLAAHLTGAGWALERGGDERGLRLLQRWLNGRVELQKPAIPDFRGELTIGDVATVADTAAYLKMLDRWARSTWAAYASLHDVARTWIDHAIQPA
jgi:uncharacterized protein DUF5946